MTPGLELLPGLLLPWYKEHKRDLPWRQDREPYHVWLSEIMLQQTRVEAVKNYYPRFLKQLPTIEALATVAEAQLLKLWEGLGYYSRARNLHKAAKLILEKYGGIFPTGDADIRTLPGIGDYTAGAIASICFNRKTPAVDGNVLRVLSRFCADYGCVDDAAVKKRFAHALQAVYPREAGDFTQALMELGATVCLPNGQPLCQSCPLQAHCEARRTDEIHHLPVRAEKKKRRQEDLTVFLLSCDDRIALSCRPDTGLLAGLYEFPNLPGRLSAEQIIQTAENWGLEPQYLEKTVGRKHIFTHIQWNMTGARVHCALRDPRFIWVTREELRSDYALPTAFRQFLEDMEL